MKEGWQHLTWSSLTLQDLCQVPPHVITFHPHTLQGSTVISVLPMGKLRLRGSENLDHVSQVGTGQRLWRATGKSAEITAVSSCGLAKSHIQHPRRRRAWGIKKEGTRTLGLLGLVFHGQVEPVFFMGVCGTIVASREFIYSLIWSFKDVYSTPTTCRALGQVLNMQTR